MKVLVLTDHPLELDSHPVLKILILRGLTKYFQVYSLDEYYNDNQTNPSSDFEEDYKTSEDLGDGFRWFKKQFCIYYDGKIYYENIPNECRADKELIEAFEAYEGEDVIWEMIEIPDDVQWELCEGYFGHEFIREKSRAWQPKEYKFEY